MENNEIIMADEFGNETVMEIVFSVDDPDGNGQYVFVVDPEDEEGETFVFGYDDTGNLYELDENDTALWEKLERIFDDYVSAQTEGEA